MIQVLLILIIFVIFAAAILQRARAYKGGGRTEFYHGSSIKLKEIRPQMSAAAGRAVVFATPSYTDAVIFGPKWNDYDLGMWGDETTRYLDEQYPNALNKLRAPVYVHHLLGAFKPLSSGLSNEYICEKAVRSTRIDFIPDALEYIRGKIQTRSWDEVTAARKNIAYVTKIDNIIAVIAAPDPNLVKITGVNVHIMGRGQMPTIFTEPTVIIGDLIQGDQRFDISCQKIYQSEDSLRSPHPAYWLAHREWFRAYKWMNPEHIQNHIDWVLMPLWRMRGRCIVVHVAGASGSGKTTLCQRLNSAGIRAIDTDDITDPIAHEARSAKYFELIRAGLAAHMDKPILVICGHTITLDSLATHKYFLDVPDTTVYERLLTRTVESICSHRAEIAAAIADHSVSTPEGFTKLTATTKIRFPGFIPPNVRINRNIRPKRESALEAGYKLATADNIFNSISAIAGVRLNAI